MRRIWACYIAYNEAHVIADSIRSVKAYVDGYVVADSVFKCSPAKGTHSSDATRQVCEKMCAPLPLTYIESEKRLTQQEARNLYLEAVPDGDWFLVIDGDEVLYGGHAEISQVVADIKSGKITDNLLIPVYTTAILFPGLGKDMPKAQYLTNPTINTWAWQLRWFQKMPGYHHVNGEQPNAFYDRANQLVAEGSRTQRCDKMFMVNHHTRQNHRGYVLDCRWVLNWGKENPKFK